MSARAMIASRYISSWLINMKTIHARIEKETFEWLKDQIRKGRFASISHAVRYALKKLMEIKKEVFEE